MGLAVNELLDPRFHKRCWQTNLALRNGGGGHVSYYGPPLEHPKSHFEDNFDSGSIARGWDNLCILTCVYTIIVWRLVKSRPVIFIEVCRLILGAQCQRLQTKVVWKSMWRKTELWWHQLLRKRRHLAPETRRRISRWNAGGQWSWFGGGTSSSEFLTGAAAASLNPADGHSRSCPTNHPPPTGFVRFYFKFLPAMHASKVSV